MQPQQTQFPALTARKDMKCAKCKKHFYEGEPIGLWGKKYYCHICWQTQQAFENLQQSLSVRGEKPRRAKRFTRLLLLCIVALLLGITAGFVMYLVLKLFGAPDDIARRAGHFMGLASAGAFTGAKYWNW